MKLPCLECPDKCEAKKWINKAYELHQAGVECKINLPCPKNGVTYVVGGEN